MRVAPTVSDAQPIGVFDSGVGGLTVLLALVQKFPAEKFVYLGDTANLPYGAKSPAKLSKYLHQAAAFFAKKNVKAMVIACNSASTVHGTLPQTLPFPVYEVIEPGAQLALKKSKNKVIGVLGTKATINSGFYKRHLKRLNPTVVVKNQACPLLVPLAEEGLIDDPLTHLAIKRYMSEMIESKVDTVILGCTHYPILKTSFEMCAPHIQFVESGEAVAQLLFEDQIASDVPSQPQRSISLYVTDEPESFLPLSQLILGDWSPSTISLVSIDQETI